MFDDQQKSEIKSIVVESLTEIAEREPRVLRENHDYVDKLREGDKARTLRRRQLFDKVAGAVIILTLGGVATLVVAGFLEWIKGNM